MSRRGVVAIAVLAGLAPSSSDAHWSASRGTSLYVARYLICNDHPELDVRCAGPIRARAQLLGDLTGTAPSRGGASPTDLARTAAIHAVYWNLADAIPALRAHLAHAPTPAERTTHRALELDGLRAEAAYALAQLGDTSAAPAIAALLAELETTGHGFVWRDTLAALAVIDPPRASRYAIEFLGRTSNFKLSLPGGSSKLDAVDYIRRDDARAALPLLERLAKQTERGADDHAHCRFMATRIRLDDALRAKVREHLVGGYSGSWIPRCAETIFRELGSPPDPADAAALIRHLGRDDRGMDFGMANLAYQRILDLLVAMRTRPDERARQLVQRGLADRAAWPHVANPRHPNYSLHFVVFHQAAEAALGRGDARARLYDIIDDPGDRGEAWLAALWALRLDLRDHQDHVGALLLRAPRQPQQQTTGVFEDVRVRVLDEFVAKHPDDPRWAALAFDLDHRMIKRPSDAAERALYHLTRHPPTLVCDRLADSAAVLADPEATEHGLLAMTAFGDRCRPALHRLIDDPQTTPVARGTALEVLGAIGDPQLGRRIEAAARTASGPAIARARVWLRRRR